MSAYLLLSRDQRKFIDLLVQRTNATEAAREVRPHVKRPDVLASQWKAMTLVREALEERENEAMHEAGIRSTQILLGLARVANASIKDFIHADGKPKAPHELSDDAARCVAGVDIEHMAEGGTRYRYRLRNANEAAKLIGQHQKLWSDNVEVHHTGPLIVEVVKFGQGKDSK